MFNYQNFTVFFLCLLTFSSSIAKKDEKTMNQMITECEGCHGQQGNSTVNENWPKLAGQNMNYLMKQMHDFQSNDKYARKNAMMNAFMLALSEKEKIKIARYYARLTGTIDTAQNHLLSLGESIYRGGDAAKKIPACLACHGPAGLGNPPAGFPRLSGQHAHYIASQLKAFRGKRNNDRYQMMPMISKKMSDADIVAVSNYISGLYG
ncbi:hypothetical protein BEV13_04830 [Rickettsiella grylli]|uniref:c-type cytochrome n=1 Tax=Rickettsiella grylli TaxID=59196 RepID=UPI0008FD6A93|nr:c-type cytochrome [Rickettsiella grylli]OIZ99879.1 hypothetical protein BEV13_04830 [Rickettsiella grylli]